MLLIETDRDSLLKPLQAVTGIVERRHTLPILSNVLIEGVERGLSFMATDLEIQVSTSAPTPPKAAKAFAITVAARKLHDILRSLPDNANISLAAEDSRLQVKTGSSRFNLQTLPAEDFPRLAEAAGAEAAITLPQRELRRVLSLVHYAMAQQDIRYYLNGLLLVASGNELRVVATDGHRLAYASTALEAPSDAREVILPRKAVLEVLKLLSDSDDPAQLGIRENQVRFAFGDVVLVSKVVDGKFPDYQRVIPTAHGKIIDLRRVEFQQALSRASILSSDKIRGVRLVLTAKALRVICTNSEQEEAQEELPVEYAGDPLDIGFNVAYLLDVLNNVDAESIQCSFSDASSSALITIPDDQSFKYVVMPMRI